MTMDSPNSIKDVLIECLRQQLNELELLQSMYPEEISWNDCKILEQVNDFVEGKTEYTPNHLDFVVTLLINNLKLEICIDLPSLYPISEEPDIYVRCNQLNRQQETLLNTKLSEYIKEHHCGEVCLYTAITWLQDNTDSFMSNIGEHNPQDDVAIVEEKFVRIWIYSHHIYNKRKREEIVKMAKKLNITGFCLSGKPGIIYIEGASEHCKEWWTYIKSMTWKKIVIRETETYDISEQILNQRFTKFEEMNLNSKETSKFIAQHGLTQAFNTFFGFSNDEIK